MMIVAAAAVVVGLLVEIIKNPPTATPLESLAAFVSAHGTPWRMPPSLAAFFNIAGKEIVFTHCSVSADGGTRTIGIRRRIDFGRTDILLINRLPNGDSECYFTSPDGKLLMSCCLDTKARKMDDAEKRFEHELDYWLAWQREQTKRNGK